MSHAEDVVKAIIFQEEPYGRWDNVQQWDRVVVARYPVVQERVAKAAGWIEELVAEAVAAEREACLAIVKECAENASKKKNLPCRGEVVGALMYAIAAIRARSKCEGRPE